jgi:hypothetical protein
MKEVGLCSISHYVEDAETAHLQFHCQSQQNWACQQNRACKKNWAYQQNRTCPPKQACQQNQSN